MFQGLARKKKITNFDLFITLFLLVLYFRKSTNAIQIQSNSQWQCYDWADFSKYNLQVESVMLSITD